LKREKRKQEKRKQEKRRSKSKATAEGRVGRKERKEEQGDGLVAFIE